MEAGMNSHRDWRRGTALIDAQRIFVDANPVPIDFVYLLS
jgi:hypothetical protein